MAREVNFVWNVCNEVIRENWRRSRKYTQKSDLNRITKGASVGLSINSQTIQTVSYEILKRTQKAKKHIRYRTRKGGKNLGWVPFQGQTIKFCGDYVLYNGTKFRLWQHRRLPELSVIKCGSFAEDSLGRWYINLTVDVPEQHYMRECAEAGAVVGIDPGTKTIATTSDGEKFERDNLTRIYEEKLAKAQRHGKKRLAKKIHAKIKNKRLDFNHKMTERLAARHCLIFFGDAQSGRMMRTRMAKGVSDAAWYQIKMFLAYKTLRRQGRMLEINEKYSTITCSGCLSRSGPSGLSGLSIREWKCGVCGSAHDRDVNAARNILRLGRETLSGDSRKGSPSL